ncbi:hypothetical protein [Sansalvadorimonas verongulae]|uniref:hypothetical protein n=1 Tax=Sansalvadorimonas verongulae TaxID=2172824 RepID=UPI0012BBBB4A|nr:hypothetical protein [Sansalvadorimonas verongulae]MTI14177.1 hypothetical protein [Sansalvadorimonas verongulae]
MSKSKEAGISIKRYVSIRNFEYSHNYTHDKQKGKPLSAYEYAKNLDICDDTKSIVNFLKQIVGEKKYDNHFTQEYLHETVVEPH